LVKAADALEIVSDKMSIAEVIDCLVKNVREKMPVS